MSLARQMGALAWFVMFVGLGVAAFGVEVDREARKSLAVVAWVPKAFRSDALQTLSNSAYADGRSEQGLSYARELVGKRPLPAEHLSLYAHGLIATNAVEMAVPAIRAAAERGWRDRFTQQIVIVSAIDQGDWKVVADRLLALWRLGERSAWFRQLSGALEEPKVRAEFVAGLRPHEKNWVTAFLHWGSGSLSPDALGQIALAMHARGDEFECGGISVKTRQMVGAGQLVAAERLWQTVCAPDGKVTAASDFAFSEPGSFPGPFDWVLKEDAGIDTEFIERQGATVLRFENTEAIRMDIAERVASLRAGPHVVRLVRGGDIVDGGAALRVWCRAADGHRALVSGVDLLMDGSTFSIPQNGCISQNLVIAARPGSGEIGGLKID